MVVMATRGLAGILGHVQNSSEIRLWCLEGLHHPEFGLDVVESLYCRRVTWL